MRLTVFMPVFNEADILPWTLKALSREGVDSVHILDGWSTDGSWDLLERYVAEGFVTRERFPKEGDNGIWGCERTLRRIEDLAFESNADWCMLSDADEIRTSGTALTLKQRLEAISIISAVNVIDFRAVVFRPVDESWDGTQDPETHFRYYEDERIGYQEKLWKNDTKVDIHREGGHLLFRPNKQLYALRFLMKHYQYRSSAHALRKIQERISRRHQREYREYRWGTHYDGPAIQAGPTIQAMSWRPDKLLEWNQDRAPGENA